MVRELNLASFSSVQDFVKETLEVESRIDVLINNAAEGYIQPRTTTVDDLDTVMQSNHIAPFLLTHLLSGTQQHHRQINLNYKK